VATAGLSEGWEGGVTCVLSSGMNQASKLLCHST
jgi:hypothetical protein